MINKNLIKEVREKKTKLSPIGKLFYFKKIILALISP